MAQHVTVARPYADAIFAIAESSQERLAAWHQVLTILAAAMLEEKFLQWLADPRIQTQQAVLVELLTAIVPNAVQKLGVQLPNFLRLLIAYGRLEAVADIQQLFEKLVANQENALSLQVTTAFELSDAQQCALITALGQRFHKIIKPQFTVDKQLIGGVKVRTDTWVMDHSIRAQLENLQQSVRIDSL